MNGVKDLLAKPDTGVDTQSEQTRIDEQLTAMIDSLRTNPKPQQFAQRQSTQRQQQGQGGQGGQQTPRLPAEAELHLLASFRSRQ